MNIVYIARVNECSKAYSGVFKKVLGQVEGMAAVGFNPYLLYMSSNKQVLAKYSCNQLVPIKEWQNIESEIEQATFWNNANKVFLFVKESINVLYMRYEVMQDKPYLNNLVSNIPSDSRVITCVEFPTFPYAKELQSEEIRDTDEINRKRLLNLVDLVFSTSNERYIDNKKSITYTNQLSQEQLRLLSYQDLSRPLIGKDKKINLLAVANMSSWHGYDRLILGLKNYLAYDPSYEVYLHIAGVGKELDFLIDLTSQSGLNKYVKFHGYCDSSKLAGLYLDASIGVGGIGLHRKGLRNHSMLKNREYLANGLPLIDSGVDLGLLDFQHILKVESSDDAVDIAELISFIKSLNLNEKIRVEIKKYAIQRLSWQVFGKLLYENVNLKKIEFGI